ncbi:MAG TPA: sigma-70 family RNA polymerase sigma factor [Gaiellales bacterium]|nr:sigma-70 family RNA polymerase sigma factor [Gaiellales bacterium]
MADATPDEAEDAVSDSPGEAPDRARFEEEALAHADQLYRIALRLSGSQQSAEELVQETYLRAFRSWRSYRPGSNLAAWLATILRNAFLDEARRQQRRPAQESFEDTTEYYLYNQLAGPTGEPQEAVLNRLAGSAIVDALADVPPAFREVVVLVDIGDFSYQEAADILGVPIGTVMSRLHRGRRALKQALAQRAGTEAS